VYFLVAKVRLILLRRKEVVGEKVRFSSADYEKIILSFSKVKSADESNILPWQKFWQDRAVVHM